MFAVFHKCPVVRDVRGQSRAAAESLAALIYAAPHFRRIQIRHQSKSSQDILPNLYGE